MHSPTQPRLSGRREGEVPSSPPVNLTGESQAHAASRRFYTELLGGSSQMREVRDLIDRVADTDVTVLVRGESGTGKELVARAVHDASTRRERTFVKVNCAALPSELLESELFGFERGAFTGAIQHKPGKFEFANHGTMFLDEISEMGLGLQSKLLQVLQDGEFARLGGRQDVKVDVRVVAATNRDLEGAVAEGQFREDLYFRLNVVCITLPPLRQRRDEIPRLTQFFLAHYSQHYNKPPMAMATDTLRLFAEYDWPGNVRELENLIKRMVILGTDTQIRREVADAIASRALRVGPIPILEQATAAAASSAAVPAAPPAAAAPPARPAAPLAAAPPPVPLCGSLKDIGRTAAREAERELIYRTLQQTRWNRREAAEILGISYKALLYKIKEAELDKAS
ncbi:MAG TPA: sigma-54 dependent transcriptional regulator [Vicinamibacterales bacterium]|nr:sigma-54 dependent transcriptional regulator [Vicinamibacterales bacterium]